MIDPYEVQLYVDSSEAKVAESQTLMAGCDKATYPTLPTSIVKHAQKHGFESDYLRYLRKAFNLNKKGARKKYLPDRRTCPMEQSVGIRTTSS